MRSIIKNFSNKCLSLSYLGEDWNNSIMQSMIEAGRTISYVETNNPSKADKLHLSIKEGDKSSFMREFEKVVRFAIAKLKLRRVKIAFDTTEDKTWMRDDYNLRPSSYEKHRPSWQYLTVSIVDPYFIPLMSVPYTMFDDLDSLVIELLKYIESLTITVDLILFDRGFYHARLIDYLDGRNRGWAWPYLMLVSERKLQTRLIQETREANLRFASYNHTFSYQKDKSSWKPSTTLMIKIVNEETAWCYATNQKPSLNLAKEYRKRWNIETGFRIHDEARIKSKSKNALIRFFYHLIGMLLIILWRLQNTVRYYVFKRYLKFAEYQFFPDEIKELLAPP